MVQQLDRRSGNGKQAKDAPRSSPDVRGKRRAENSSGQKKIGDGMSAVPGRTRGHQINACACCDTACAE